MGLPVGNKKSVIEQKSLDLFDDMGQVDKVACKDTAIFTEADFDPDFCRLVVDAMRHGLSKKAAAGAIGISYEVFEKWRDKYPKFDEAVKVGETLNATFWEKQGIKNLIFVPTGKQINSKVYQMNMQARFGWGESKEEAKKQTRLLAFEINEPSKHEA